MIDPSIDNTVSISKFTACSPNPIRDIVLYYPLSCYTNKLVSSTEVVCLT